jgi:hypothetical protein
VALEAGDEFASLGQLRGFAVTVTCPVTSHSFAGAEGAGGRCESPGQRLEHVVCGWLEATRAGHPP